MLHWQGTFGSILALGGEAEWNAPLLGQAVIHLSPDGVVRAVNAAYLQLTGQSREDVVGRACSALHRCNAYLPSGHGSVRWLRGGPQPPESPCGENFCERCPLHTPDDWQPRLVWLTVTATGEQLPVAVSYTRMGAQSDPLQGLLAFFHDLRELHTETATCNTELCRLGQELTLASQVDELVPYRREPTPGLEVALLSRPLRPVGGDLAEVFRIAEGTILYVADLSGKSLPAALMLPGVRRLCHQELQGVPPQTVHNLNRALVGQLPDGVFLALSLMLVQDSRVKVCNAGSELPWLYHKTARRSLPVGVPGMVLGVEPGAHLATQDLKLDQGDVLALWSDGFSELLEIASLTPETWILQLGMLPAKAMQTMVCDFVDSVAPRDDVSFLAVRR